MTSVVQRVLAKRAQKARAAAEADERKRFMAEAKGEPGMRWRGAYNKETQYEKGDVVSHKGSSYIAADACQGVAPPAKPWEPVALRGKDGKPGKNGEVGAVLIGGGSGSSSGGGSGPGGPVYWADILDKPTEFAPEAHGHTIAEVEGLPEALAEKEISGAAAAAVAAHEAEENPHPEYANAAVLAEHIGAGGAVHAEASTAAAGFMSAADKSKLDGVAAGATANATDADLRDRSTHTGAQSIETITGLESALAAKVAADTVGAANGVAPLGADNKVPAAYLPGFVDDVIEASDFASLPGTGEAGKLYVTLDNSKAWRWSGSAYVEISASPGSTDAVPEGSVNQYFTAARVRDTVLTGLSLLTNAAISATDSVLQALGKLQAQISGHLANTSNPHGVTKAQVGLGNVDNTSDADKPVSIAQLAALDSKYPLSTTIFTGDADTLTTPGAYFVGSSATNIPVSANGTLYVGVAGSGRNQMYIRTPGTNVPQIWFRTYGSVSAAWTSWERLVGTNGGTVADLVISASISAPTYTLEYGFLTSLATAVRLSPATADGADDSSTAVTGGAVATTARGGYITVNGNEHASQAGNVRLIAGAATGAVIELYNGGQRFFVDETGALYSHGMSSALTNSTVEGLYYSFANKRLQLSTNGDYPLLVNRNTSDGTVMNFRRGGVSVGTVSVTASATAYNTSSDYRLKMEVVALTDSGAFIDSLKPRQGKWRVDGSRFVGFLAHELQSVSPSSVTGEKDAVEAIGRAVIPEQIIENKPYREGEGVTWVKTGEVKTDDGVIDIGTITIAPKIFTDIPESEAPEGAVWTQTGTRPVYQAVEYGSAEVMAHIVAELQSLRLRVAAMEPAISIGNK